MAVIKKSGERWSVIANVDGTATDVNSVDFCDFNNDGKMEIMFVGALYQSKPVHPLTFILKMKMTTNIH